MKGPRKLHRVGRRPDPWGWVPWQYGPFAGQGYRLLYAGRSRFACFVEILAAFRPDICWLATLDDVEGDSGMRSLLSHVMCSDATGDDEDLIAAMEHHGIVYVTG